MSSAISNHTESVGGPPRRFGVRRMLSFAIALLIALGAALASAAPAQAGSHGVGYDIGLGWLGSYSTDVDGRQAYCIDIGLAAPFGSTSGPQTVTSIDSLSAQQLAQLNYVLGKWGQNSDPSTTAAVALFVWGVADAGEYNSHGMSGDQYYVARAPSSARPTILANLSTMRAEASAFAVANPSLSLSIDMADQYNGTLTVAASPAHLQGTASLSGGVFSTGSATRVVGAGQYPIVGTPDDGAPSYQIGASMTVNAVGYGAKVDLYRTGNAQRIIAAVAGAPGNLAASTQTPVIDLDFQPVIGTEVATRFVQAGDGIIDHLEVSVTKGTWTKLGGERIPIRATGTLYGPFDEQPAESETPPLGAPVAATVELTLAGAGDYTSPSGVTAPQAGFYTWVWAIDKDDQGELGRYLTGSFTDRFGRLQETAVTPFAPRAVSTAQQRLVVPGDPLTDRLVVSSDNGAWLRVDGAPIPVVFEGTLYQVPGVRPPASSPAVDPVAVAVGSVTISANGPGAYISPVVVAPAAGFVTWVWEVKVAAQPEWVRPYLAGDWQDAYGAPTESTSVRWPIVTTSLMREFNVHDGGRAFDTVTVTGFPADHGTFLGDGYWNADLDEVTHSVYGPFATESELTDDLDLEDAPLLTRIVTPARNGVYNLGYSDADRIVPTQPGYYVLVTEFEGDDRVQPYTSSVSDILERFYVPPPSPPVTPLTVITQATPAVQTGEEFDDAALVQGSIPAGATLQFSAHGPLAVDAEPVCAEPFFVSDLIPVPAPGVYRSGATSVDTAGSVYWIASLYDADGTALAEGACGAPGETTVVTAPPPMLAVTTNATPTVLLGEPARDVATVTGEIPEGARLGFQAYRQAGEAPACTEYELVFTSAPVVLDGAGEYTSESVVFEEAGRYFWIATVVDAEGAALARGLCGAPDETTIVAVPPLPPTPELAFTGMGDWLVPAGVGAGLFLLAGAGVLVFGRRLAMNREAAGYVRDEDREYLGLEDIDGLADAADAEGRRGMGSTAND